MASKVKITFLGTADSIPDINRNHVSILLDYLNESILIDCGEGTQRQFRKSQTNICRINKILITHWHADHVLGLPGLLSTLSFSGYNKILEIYAPLGTKKNFLDMLKAFDLKLNYEIRFKEISKEKFFENDNFYLESEEMQHGVNCLAYNILIKGNVRIKEEVVLKLGSGKFLADLKAGKDIVVDGKKYFSKKSIYLEKDKKISIVLDTQDNLKIIPFVKNADVFICEGTFAKELLNEAKEKKHLTINQVGKISKKAKVKKLFVIHISSRYLNKFSILKKQLKEEFENFVFPKDLDTFEF